MQEDQSKFENATHILGKALSFIFNDGDGIYIKLDNEDGNMVVFKKDGQIFIYKTDEVMEDGTRIVVNNNSEN